MKVVFLRNSISWLRRHRFKLARVYKWLNVAISVVGQDFLIYKMDDFEAKIASLIEKYEAEGSSVTKDLKSVLEKTKEIFRNSRKERLNKGNVD